MFRRFVLPLALSALPWVALAHPGTEAGAHHGFEAGLAHPFTGADHLLAMLAVGLWSALAAPTVDRRMLVWPLSFACLLLVGALLGAGGLVLPAVEPAIAASVLVLGLLVASGAKLPLPVGATLVGAFAVFHGVAHGRELEGSAAFAGMVLATLLLHAGGLGAGGLLRQGPAWAGRLAGAVVGASGLMLLVA